MSSEAGPSSSGNAVSQQPAIPSLSSIDDVIAASHQWSDADPRSKPPTALVSALDKLAASAHKRKDGDVLLKPTKESQDPLELLDPHHHTIAYAYILAARATHVLSDLDASVAITPFIDNFIATFNPQHAHFASSKVTELANAITVIGSKGAINPNWTLNVLSTLLHKFVEPFPAILTTLHPIILAHCVRTRQYQFAQQAILSRPISSVDKTISPLKGIDIIDYFYYAGLIHVELRNWQAAEEMFEATVAVPVARIAHDRQNAAAQRLMLVQLIKDGKINSRSETAPSAVANKMRSWGRAYSELATHYASTDRRLTLQDIEACVAANVETFERDETLRLVGVALSVYNQRKIIRLSKSFHRLGVADVVRLLSLKADDETVEHAETRVTRLIEEMISSGSLNAALQPSSASSSPILDFSSSSSTALTSKSSSSNNHPYDSLASIDELNRHLHELTQLNVYIEAQEREIAASKTYVQKQQTQQQGPGGQSSGGGGGGGGGGGSLMGRKGNGKGGSGGRGGGGGDHPLRSSSGYDDDENVFS